MSDTNNSHKPLQLNQCKDAQLSHDKDHPYSAQFDDIYFYPEDGKAESEYVFLKGNQLPQRWQQKPQFCIAETGFGSGLNFLNCWHMWQQHKPQSGHLHYVSAELFPLSSQQLQTALSVYPDLQPLIEQLLEQYPERMYGFHQLNFPRDELTLTLMFGDAKACFEQWNGFTDVWFLDGFSPAKNPELWNQELMDVIARKSHTNATLATFTAAGHVRKKIESAGFEVTKIKGFGRKREMITAVYKAEQLELSREQHPWHTLSKHLMPNRSVAIIGAGIAGLALARRCQQRGLTTHVIDPAPTPCHNTSALPHAVVKPHLHHQATTDSLFYWRAFLYALRQYPDTALSKQGILMTSGKDNQAQFEKIKQAFKLGDALLQFTAEGLLFPQAGSVDSQKLVKQWLHHIDHYHQKRVADFHYDNGWHLYDAQQKHIVTADALVIAAGMHSIAFPHIDSMRMEARYGQVSICKTPDDWFQRHVLMDKGYLLPTNDGHLLCGSTFEHLPPDTWLQSIVEKPKHWEKNRTFWDGSAYEKMLAGLTPVDCYSGIRASTADRLPVCGAVIDSDRFKQDYSDLHHGRHWQQYPEAEAIPHLYIMSGLGSRGFTTAPLLAEILTSIITDAPLPCEQEIIQALHPNRFLYRALKKPVVNT